MTRSTARSTARTKPQTKPRTRPTKKDSNADLKNLDCKPKSGIIIPQDTEAADDVSLAKQALRELLTDKLTPAAARASAARTLLELNAALGKNAKPENTPGSKPLNELSRAELEAELSALSDGVQ